MNEINQLSTQRSNRNNYKRNQCNDNNYNKLKITTPIPNIEICEDLDKIYDPSEIYHEDYNSCLEEDISNNLSDFKNLKISGLIYKESNSNKKPKR